MFLFKSIMIYEHCSLDTMCIYLTPQNTNSFPEQIWIGESQWSAFFHFDIISTGVGGVVYLVFVCFYYFLQISVWLLHSCIILKFIVYLIAFLFFMIMSVMPIRGYQGICFEFLSIATTSRNYLTELWVLFFYQRELWNRNDFRCRLQ